VEIGQYLEDLIIQLLTFDQQSSHPAPPGQGSISRQEHPVLSEGQARQLMIIQARVKKRIIAKDAQPLGKTAKHSVGDK